MWIDLDGLANLRDVGGMPTTDGGQITAGRLLRSDNLQALTTTDIDRLLELGLSDVVDLRSEYEVESEPQLAAALARGLLAHRAGAVLATSGFLRRGLIRPEPADRLAILGHTTSPTAEAEGLTRWLSKIHTKNSQF